VDGRGLACALSRVLYAAGDASRGHLAHVHCLPAGRRLRLTATDGYRAATTTCLATSPADATAFLLPAQALAELVRLLPRHTGVAVAIQTGDPTIVAWAGTRFMTSAPADAEWPDLAQFIPEARAVAFPLTGALVRALTCLPRARGLAGVRLTLDVALQTLRLDGIVEGEQVGGVTLGLGPGGAHGEAGDVEVSVTYLRQALATLTTVRARIRMAGPHRPLVVTPDAACEDTAIIMPITRPT
jgi:DNA polymerase III sliding clamp (beta) subunit (PCNA family)